MLTLLALYPTLTYIYAHCTFHAHSESNFRRICRATIRIQSIRNSQSDFDWVCTSSVNSLKSMSLMNEGAGF